MAWLEQALGALIVVVILLDIFLVVLYARINSGILSYRIARVIWLAFLRFSKAFGPDRGVVLSFCGPAILVLVLAFWAFGLTIGAALIVHPYLGTSIRAGNGETSTDFITAMYAGGSSMSIVGSSDFTPQSSAFRMLFLLNSLIGMSVVSLTLTYLMQVYNALQHRNQLALNLHLAGAETGDAAEVLAGLGPRGQFSAGYTNLAQLAVDISGAKESHHFYPVLFYFRFREPYYSVSRFALLSLDLVSLIKSALDDDRYGWLKQSAAVTQLWRASMVLVTTLEDTFLPTGVPRPTPPDEATRERWGRRYLAAAKRLREAGIDTAPDEAAGAQMYASLRMHWDVYIQALAPALGYTMEEVDPAGHSKWLVGQPNRNRPGALS